METERTATFFFVLYPSGWLGSLRRGSSLSEVGTCTCVVWVWFREEMIIWLKLWVGNFNDTPMAKAVLPEANHGNTIIQSKRAQTAFMCSCYARGSSPLPTWLWPINLPTFRLDALVFLGGVEHLLKIDLEYYDHTTHRVVQRCGP